MWYLETYNYCKRYNIIITQDIAMVNDKNTVYCVAMKENT